MATINSTIILTGYHGVFEPIVGHLVRGDSPEVDGKYPALGEHLTVDAFRRLFYFPRVTGAWFDSERYCGEWNMEDKILRLPFLDAVTVALRNANREVPENQWVNEVFTQAMQDNERIVVIDTVFPEWVVENFSLVKENGTNICMGIPGANLYRYQGVDALLVRTDFRVGVTEEQIEAIRNYILS